MNDFHGNSTNNVAMITIIVIKMIKTCTKTMVMMTTIVMMTKMMMIKKTIFIIIGGSKVLND